MSEIKLNLTDAQYTISGAIHGSVADACIAALSAEPETIQELETALSRYQKPDGDNSPFASFRKGNNIDTEAWDAGIVVIDLAGRIVMSESTYSSPQREGEVNYHDGVSATDVAVLYRLSDEWLFLSSIQEYERLSDIRRRERAAAPRFDARQVLYGRPLIEWLVSAIYTSEAEAVQSAATVPTTQSHANPAKLTDAEGADDENPDPDDEWRKRISEVHARWLTTPRDDLQGQSPRDVLLARQDFIDFDLHSRSMQWSQQGEGPPCLSTDSFAYRFAGFGTHEWVIYYDLVRYLLRTALSRQRPYLSDPSSQKGYVEQLERLEKLKTEWLERPQDEYDRRIPALLIENERIRLPIAMRGHDMVIDDDCPVCQMMANDTDLGMEMGFWHLDGSHMDDEFAFSDVRTKEEWEAQLREWEEFTERFNREWEERQERENLPVADFTPESGTSVQ